nr:MAG TPA: hypothetical protein [Caudoviricetes sp.]
MIRRPNKKIPKLLQENINQANRYISDYNNLPPLKSKMFSKLEESVFVYDRLQKSIELCQNSYGSDYKNEIDEGEELLGKIRNIQVKLIKDTNIHDLTPDSLRKLVHKHIEYRIRKRELILGLFGYSMYGTSPIEIRDIRGSVISQDNLYDRDIFPKKGNKHDRRRH